MKTTLAVALLGLVTLSACGQRTDSTMNSDRKINGDSPVTDSAAPPPGQKDVEDPRTGTNSARPDSPKDLRPGTDGSGTPPAPTR